MDFTETEELQAFRAKIRDFAEKEIAPIANKYDKSEEFPWDTVKKMATMGLFGIVFPKKYGGMELDYQHYAIAVEELSRICGSHGITVASHNSLCTNHIYIASNDEQKERWLPDLCSGRKLGAWGLTEPNAGSDAASQQTTAVLEGDEWVLNGQKMFITQGSVGEIWVIMAITDRSKGNKGISAFVVEKDTPGFRPGQHEIKVGLHASDTTELIMEDCRVPKENLLGEINMGFIDTMKTLDGGRISIASMALGLAQGALDHARAYIKNTVVDGRPLFKSSSHQWLLADMNTEVEAARMLVYRAANLKDKGQKVTRESSMAKLYAAETGSSVARKAMNIIGQNSLTDKYPVNRILRDVKLCEIGEGTSEIQRLVISRQILR